MSELRRSKLIAYNDNLFETINYWKKTINSYQLENFNFRKISRVKIFHVFRVLKNEVKNSECLSVRKSMKNMKYSTNFDE